MPSPFEAWTLSDAQEAVRKAFEAVDLTKRAFVQGDHWQSGEGWTGPRPDARSKAYTETLTLIERAFVAENIIGEAATRHGGGVVGREPAWSMTLRRPLADDEEPTTDEAALIHEAEALLTEWWDVRRIRRQAREGIITLLWAERSAFRLFVPSGLIGEGTVEFPRRVPLANALSSVHVTTPAPKTVAVYVDPTTLKRVGIFVYTDQLTSAERAEISFLADDGRTVLRHLGGEGVLGEALLPLGGQLTIFEMTRDPFVTEPIIRQQKKLNKILTMESHNIDLAGFLERVFINTELPWHYESDTTAPDGRRKVYDPLTVGAGTTNVLKGITSTDETGNTSIATPSVVYRDPVPVTTFTESAGAARSSILRQCHQLHVALSGDAVASGESRRQAVADYISDMRLTKPEVDAAGRWLLETALALAAHFAGQPLRYAGLRAVFETRLDPGPVPIDEQRVIMEMVDHSLISQQTGMARVDVEDGDAEMQSIMSEQGNSAADRAARAVIVKTLTEAGAGLAGAAEIAGFDEDEVKVLVDSVPPPPPETPAPVLMPFGAPPVAVPATEAAPVPVEAT